MDHRDPAIPDLQAANEIKRLQEAGRIADSIHYGEAQYRRHPDYMWTPCALAKSYFLTHHYKKAETLYAQVMKTHPDQPRAYNGYSLVAITCKRIEEAEARCNAALQKFPDDKIAKRNTAWIEKLRKRFSETRKRFETQVTLSAEDTFAYNGYIYLLIKHEDYLEARNLLLRRQQLQSNNELNNVLMATLGVYTGDVELMTRAYLGIAELRGDAKRSRLLMCLEAMGVEERVEYRRPSPESLLKKGPLIDWGFKYASSLVNQQRAGPLVRQEHLPHTAQSSPLTTGRF